MNFFTRYNNMVVLLTIVCLLFLSTEITAKSNNKNYIQCEDDNIEKYTPLSVPGKELICHDLKISKNDVIEKFSRKKKNLIQFVSVNGTLHSKLIDSATNVFVYKSFIIDFSLSIKHRGNLMIALSKFPEIKSDFFKEATQIRFLGFYSNPELTFGEGCFSNLRHLRGLTVYNESIPVLESGFLEGLYKLRRLVIVKSGLESIKSDAFIHNDHLKELILDYNPLKEFSVNISSLYHLRKISLLKTDLKELNLPIFIPVNYLNTLALPNDVWSEISVVRLALAFPRLRTAVFEEREEENKGFNVLKKDLESSGVQVRTVDVSKVYKSFMFDEDIEVVKIYD